MARGHGIEKSEFANRKPEPELCAAFSPAEQLAHSPNNALFSDVLGHSVICHPQ